MRTRARSLVAFAFLASCIAAVTAPAGNLNFLGESPISYFTADDVQLMRQNALKVLDAPGANAKQTWSNEKTGASGGAQVRGQFTASDGATCKRLRLTNSAQGQQSDATYTVCKYPERGWVVNPDAAPAR